MCPQRAGNGEQADMRQSDGIRLLGELTNAVHFTAPSLQRLVVSNCCVKAKGITSIATECAGLTHLVFAVYKVTEPADMRELQVGSMPGPVPTTAQPCWCLRLAALCT